MDGLLLLLLLVVYSVKTAIVCMVSALSPDFQTKLQVFALSEELERNTDV